MKKNAGTFASISSFLDGEYAFRDKGALFPLATIC